MEKNILFKGIALYTQKQYADALTFFLTLPENSNANEMDLAYYTGLCYARLGKYDDSLLCLEQVVTGESDYERVLQCRYILAIIYAKSNRMRLADFELNKLLEAGYDTANVLSSLAYIRWQNGETEKCLEYYRRSLEIDAENVTALNGMGYVLAQENRDLSHALILCKRALDNSPKNAACMDSLGWIYLKLGLLEKAQEYLYKAHEMLPQNMEIQDHIDAYEEALTER